MPKEIEASVQMRLYTLSKRHFAMVIVGFCLCFAISVLVGAAGPSVVFSEEHPSPSHSSRTLQNATTSWLKTGPFMLQTRMQLSRFNQQLWLLMKPTVEVTDAGTMFSVPFNVTMLIDGTDGDLDVDIATVSNKTRMLHCPYRECSEVVLLHLGYVDYSRYTVTVTLTALPEQPVHFKDIVFYFKTYNPAFTQFEIWFRFAFVVSTFIASVLFTRSLRMYRWRLWSTEQRWTSCLLPLLLLYNNPLFATAFLVKSWIPLFCDGLFQATFLCALLLFFLCLYHGLRVAHRRFISFYLPKLAVVGLLWLPAVTLSTWQAVHELEDPSYQYKLDIASFTGFKIFMYFSSGLYAMFLLYYLVRAFVDLRHVPYFDIRLKFTSGLMLVVLVISLTFIALRFGSAVVNDNFVLDIASRYANAAEFLSFFGLLNVYLCTMAVVYSPSKNAQLESRLLDNPVVTLLNDSEDDIDYGSEKEASSGKSKPLKSFDDSD